MLTRVHTFRRSHVHRGEKSVEGGRRQHSAFDGLCHAVVEVALRQRRDACNVNPPRMPHALHNQHNQQA